MKSDFKYLILFIFVSKSTVRNPIQELQPGNEAISAAGVNLKAFPSGARSHGYIYLTDNGNWIPNCEQL
jgi:hypothetical protein